MLLDLRMPEMDGRDVGIAHPGLSGEAGRGAALVALTANATTEADRDECLRRRHGRLPDQAGGS